MDSIVTVGAKHSQITMSGFFAFVTVVSNAFAVVYLKNCFAQIWRDICRLYRRNTRKIKTRIVFENSPIWVFLVLFLICHNTDKTFAHPL